MGSYTRVPEDLWDMDLDPTSFRVYVALLSFAWDEPRCWPSQTTIGDRASLSRRAVQRALERLADAGLVTMVTRRPKTTLYELALWCPAGEYETEIEEAQRVRAMRRL